MSKLLKAYDRSRVPLYIQVASVMRQRIEATNTSQLVASFNQCRLNGFAATKVPRPCWQ